MITGLVKTGEASSNSAVSPISPIASISLFKKTTYFTFPTIVA
jgi:hypothetical protein